MKLIESSVEIIPQESGLEGIYKQCELAGRTAYKSQDRITEGSAKKFVEAMMKLKHGAVLEHGTIYLKYESEVVRGVQECDVLFQKYKNNKFSVYNTSKVTRRNETIAGGYVTTNLRVLMENDWMDDLQYLCEPTEYHERRVTAKFICSRGVSHEAVRHRTMSFLMESQRYVAYNREKFGSEITYIIPEWVKDKIYDYADSVEPMTGFSRSYILDGSGIPNIVKNHMLALSRAVNCWYESLKNAESDYMYLVTEEELKAEEARGVLPNDCKTELIMTGFVSDWNHFFNLRSKGITGKPHPDIKVLADSLLIQFVNSGYIK